MQVNYQTPILAKQNIDKKAALAKSAGLHPCSNSEATINYATPSSINYKALYLNNITKKNKLSFGKSLDENLTSWGATVNKDGTKFKVWANWAQQMFVQAVPPDSPDPSQNDDWLPEYKRAFPWHYEAQKVGFIIQDLEEMEYDKKEKKLRPKQRDLPPNTNEQFVNDICDRNRNPRKILKKPDKNIGRIKGDVLYELRKASEDGVFESETLPEIKPGWKYRFIFVNTDGHVIYRHDPNSYQLDNVRSWSTVVDHNSFDWGNQKRTTEPGNPDVLKAPNTKAFNYTHDKGNVSQTVTYAVHLGTLSEKGDYESAKKEIDKIVKKHPELTHIELMPLETTYSQNWGYDGVSTGKFAPTPHYGSPDPNALKDFIKYTQDKGLGVLIDMVPNHYSHNFADGVAPFGPYETSNEAEKNECAWGKLYNYEGKEKGFVRDSVTRMALNWLVNYNANGLRLDMTQFMKSDDAFKQLSEEIRYHVPDAILVAEDGRDGNGESCDNRVTNPLATTEACNGKGIEDHNIVISRSANNQSSTNNIGMDLQWGFHLQHQLFCMVSGNTYPLNNKYKPDIIKFDRMFRDPNASKNVIYTMSHDEIGNIGGLRLISKIMVNNLNMASRVEGLGDKGHLADLATQNMIEAYYNKGFCNKDVRNPEANKEWADYQQNITYKERDYDEAGNLIYYDKKIKVNNINLEEFKNALDYSRTCHKLAIGTTFAFPAPKMIFQGDEYGAIEPFYFFRNEPPGPDLISSFRNVRNQKGYDYSSDIKDGTFNAFKRSKLNRDNISEGLKSEYDKTEAFEQKVEEIYHDNPALKIPNNDSNHLQTYVYHHNGDNILQVHRTDENGNDILAIMNFGDKEYDSFELNRIGNMPSGTWKEEINSDDKAYGGSGKYVTETPITETNEKLNIKIPKKGFIILKHTNNEQTENN